MEVLRSTARRVRLVYPLYAVALVLAIVVRVTEEENNYLNTEEVLSSMFLVSARTQYGHRKMDRH
eukprot:9471506-Pyramimonas_sp.AAC.1